MMGSTRETATHRMISQAAEMGTDAITKRLGISTTYWNHGIYCDYCLGKPHGMMEQWNFGRLDNWVQLDEIYILIGGINH